MTDHITIGVDVGGTKIAAGRVDAKGRVSDRVTVPTGSGSAAQLTKTIADTIAPLLTHGAVAVGIGAAGLIDAVSGHVRFAPHLPWRDEPVRDDLADRLGVPVVLDNDATAAAHGEWRFGSGRGVQDMILVNLGTGIGGGLVLGGAVYRGRGMAGEFGHEQIEPQGRPCECGNRGCWEQYASGRVLDRSARAAVSAQNSLGIDLLAAAGSPEAVSGHHLGELALDGQPEALAAVADVGHWLGLGLANLAAALDPETFVIGGGVSLLGDLVLAPARAAMEERLVGRSHREPPAVLAAALGADSALIGAADLARL